MKTISFELTQLEFDVLSMVAQDPVDWVSNFAKERCRIKLDEIVNMVVQRCLSEGRTIPSTKEDMVELAVELGWIGQPITII